MNLNSTKEEIRKFGLVALLFFGALCAVAFWREKKVFAYFLGALCFLGMCFVALPGVFRPVYRAWLKGAHMIGTCITVLILSLAYYLVITPAAWIKRVIGGAPLPLKPDPEAPSYWVARKEPAQPRERFFLRY